MDVQIISIGENYLQSQRKHTGYLMMFDKRANLKYKFGNRHLWQKVTTWTQ